MKRALIFTEQDYQNDAVDLLETVRQIYGEEPYRTYALVMNADGKDLMSLFDAVIRLSDSNIRDYDLTAAADIIAGLHSRYKFDSILMPASPRGRMLAPRVAMRLKTGIVADVTEIYRTEDRLELVRPAYSGRIMAGITVTGDGPVMMTVRSGVFTYEQKKAVHTEIIEADELPYRRGGINLLGCEEKIIEYDIRDSGVLISGGGGISGDFDSLKPLAQALGGQVSASRAIVDKGIVPRSIQVGQSGKTVSPGLYFAVGINGAIQHVEGLKNVDYIISVNTNRNAPICSLSDIVVEGDASTFITKLTNKIMEETS